jgi:hypothetical protein
MPRRNGNPAQLGDHIRTMYPKFRGSVDVPSGGDGGDINLPTQPHNNAAIRIVRALPNPPGLADQGEWVELENVSSFDFGFSEWWLSDEEGRVQPMSGTLASGQVRRIELTRVNEGSPSGRCAIRQCRPRRNLYLWLIITECGKESLSAVKGVRIDS